MNEGWFYGDGPSRVGPVASAELERQLITGALTRSTKVWSQQTGWLTVDAALRGQNYGALPAIPDQDLSYIIPTGQTSGLALVAGYIGIVGCFMAPIGPIAIALGIFALRDLKRNPQKNGKGRAVTGIVLGSIGTAITLLWAFLAIFRPH